MRTRSHSSRGAPSLRFALFHVAAAVAMLASLAGCASIEASAPPATAERRASATVRADADEWMPKADAPVPDTAAAPARAVGDFVVYRFTGAFRKHPMTLSQKVVARDGDAVVLAITLDDGSSKQELRVRTSDAGPTRGEVTSVTRVEGGKEIAVANEAFDKLLAKTTLAADSNEAMLGAEDVEVEIGGAKLACKKTTFQVKVGGRTATMKTTSSDAFAWGDVAGEITAKDGSLLYKAEVVEAGHADEPKPVAKGLYDDEL